MEAIGTKEFLNTIFHELRIPISSIGGYASLLLTGELGKLSKPQFNTIQRIRDVSVYASELINNLLSVSRLETREAVQYEKTSIHDLIKRSIITVEPQIRSQGLKVSKKLNKDLGEMWCIPVDIEQILINILGNAVKYTPAKGHIAISVLKKPEKLYIVIKDTGIGIPAKASDRIFTAFFRADNVAHKYEGSGLGLSIVKKLLEYNKGDISIKSKQDKGTTVEITFPLLSDRDVFESELEYQISEALRLDAKLSLLMILERGGGTYKGKETLDNIILQTVRKEDRIYNIEPGKWTAILPNSGYAEIHLVHEQLKSLLQKRTLTAAKKTKSPTPPAACMAFAIFPTNGSSKEELLSYLQREIKEPSSFITMQGR